MACGKFTSLSTEYPDWRHIALRHHSWIRTVIQQPGSSLKEVMEDF
jgi:hypothetical protein